MTSTIHDTMYDPMPVLVNFGWTQGSVKVNYTIETTFPPSAPAGFPNVYVAQQTPTSTLIQFDCTNALGLGLPTLTIPPGIQIVQYRWNLGDGTILYGPTVQHTYRVAFPNGTVILTVTDTLGRTFSAAQPLNLYNTVGATMSRGRIRRNT